MGLIFGLFRLAFMLVTLATIGVIAIVGYLVLSGSGSAPSCAPPSQSALELVTNAIAFDAKLASFTLARGDGPLRSVPFGEDETEARAQVFFDGRTGRVSDIAVCFEDGSARGFARLGTVFGRKVGVSAKASLDLSGPHPRIRISSAHAAGVEIPSIVRDRLEDLVNEELQGIDLVFPMSLTFSEDEVTLSRVP